MSDSSFQRLAQKLAPLPRVPNETAYTFHDYRAASGRPLNRLQNQALHAAKQGQKKLMRAQ
jgi:hypothetical protein